MSELINSLCETWYKWIILQRQYKTSNSIDRKRKTAEACEIINENVSKIVDNINKLFV